MVSPFLVFYLVIREISEVVCLFYTVIREVSEVSCVVCCWTVVQGPQALLESQLTSKVGCFQLLEVMYSRLSREEVNSPQSLINRKVCFGNPDTGKEMTQKITKSVKAALKCVD